MFYGYVLRSEKNDELYIGSTNDLKRRMRQHQEGHVVSTKARRPFLLVYYEAYASEADARMRETRLKDRGQARRQLKERIALSLRQSES